MKSRRQQSAYDSRPGLIIQDTLPSSNIVNKTCSTTLSSTLSSFDKTSQSSITALMKDARACETASTTFPKSATSEHVKTDARGLKSRVVDKPKLFRNDINFHSSENLDKISIDFGCKQKDCLLCSETLIVLGVKEESAKIETVGDYNDFNAGVVVSDSSAVSVFACDFSCDCLREDHNSELVVNNNYAQPDCKIDSSQHSNCGKCPQDDPKIVNSVAVNSPPRFRTVISNAIDHHKSFKLGGTQSEKRNWKTGSFPSVDVKLMIEKIAAYMINHKIKNFYDSFHRTAVITKLACWKKKSKNQKEIKFKIFFNRYRDELYALLLARDEKSDSTNLKCNDESLKKITNAETVKAKVLNSCSTGSNLKSDYDFTKMLSQNPISGTTNDQNSPWFCLCMKPDDGEFYILCETCQMWFHPQCIFQLGSLALQLNKKRWQEVHLACVDQTVNFRDSKPVFFIKLTKND